MFLVQTVLQSNSTYDFRRSTLATDYHQIPVPVAMPNKSPTNPTPSSLLFVLPFFSRCLSSRAYTLTAVSTSNPHQSTFFSVLSKDDGYTSSIPNSDTPPLDPANRARTLSSCSRRNLRSALTMAPCIVPASWTHFSSCCCCCCGRLGTERTYFAALACPVCLSCTTSFVFEPK